MNDMKDNILCSKLKIQSWNIQSSKNQLFNKFDDPSFTRSLLEHDVVCLQEIRQAVKVPGFRSFCNTRPDEKHGGVAILLKNELVGGFERVIKHKSNDLLICKLKKSFFKFERDIFIVNAYITPITSSATKSYDGRDLIHKISEVINDLRNSGDIILCGDFNSRIADDPGLLENEDDKTTEHIPLPHDYTPDKLIIRISQDMQRNPLCKVFLSLIMDNRLKILNGRTLGDLSGALTCINYNGCSVVDYFAISHSLSPLVETLTVLPFTQYSDHKPLSLVLSTSKLRLFTKTQIETSYIPAPARFLIDESSKSKFKETQLDDLYVRHYKDLADVLNNFEPDSESNRDKINGINNSFTNYLHKMASDCFKTTKTVNESGKKNKKNNPWFNHKCRRSKRELNKAARTTSNFPTSDFLRTNYYKVKKSYKSLIKKQKDSFFDKLNRDIEAGKILNWNQFKKLKNFKSDKTDFDNYDMNNFESFFTDLYSDDHKTVTPTEKQRFIDEANRINSTSEPSPTLNDPIVTSEVKHCISSLKSGKASSFDMISNEILKGLNDFNVSLLTKLFNICLSSGTYPWNVNIITPLHKKGSKDDPDNYRAVAVSSVIGKLFSTILLNRLIEFRKIECPDPPNQLGFTKKAQTYDHILTMQTIAAKYKKSKRNVNAVFVDFRKAFDSICRQALFFKLAQNGITGNLFNVLSDMYANSYAHIKLSGRLSNKFDIKKGTEQGHPLSPDLFKIFLSDLSPLLEFINCPKLSDKLVSHLLWADDLILLSLDHATSQLQLDKLSNFCDQWGIEINKLKTKVVIFGSNKSHSHVKFMLNGEPLEVVDSYCYLGIILHKSGTLQLSINDLKCKATRAMFGLKRTVNRSKLSFRALTTLFDSLIKPILLYGAPVWMPSLPIIKHLCNSASTRPHQVQGIISKINRIPFEITHQFFLKWALGTHRKSSNIGTLGESGRYPLIYQSIKLTLSYYQRVENLSKDSLVYAALQEQKSLMLPWYKNIESLLKIDEIFHLDHVSAYRYRKKTHNNDSTSTHSHQHSQATTSGSCFIHDPSKFVPMNPLPSRDYRPNHIIKCLKEHFRVCWEHEKSTSSKLEFYHSIKKSFQKEPYLDIIHNPYNRYRTTKLRISAHDLEIESGRYAGLRREERSCKWCSLSLSTETLEDESHVLFNCDFYADIRAKLWNNLLKLKTHNPSSPNNLSSHTSINRQINTLTLQNSLMKFLSPNAWSDHDTDINIGDPLYQYHFVDDEVGVNIRSRITNAISCFISKCFDKRWGFLKELSKQNPRAVVIVPPS